MGPGREASVRDLWAAFYAPSPTNDLDDDGGPPVQKGLLCSRGRGGGFPLRARLTEDHLRTGVAADLIGTLLGQDSKRAPRDVDLRRRGGGAGRALLDELEALVRHGAGSARREPVSSPSDACVVPRVVRRRWRPRVARRLAAGRFVPDAAVTPPSPRAASSRCACCRAPGRAVAGGLTLPGCLLHEPRRAARWRGLAFSLLVGRRPPVDRAGDRPRAADWWASRRLHRAGRARDGPGAYPGARSACRIRDPFRSCPIVGILRPRLFVAAKVLERLSAADCAPSSLRGGHVARPTTSSGCVGGSARRCPGRGAPRAALEGDGAGGRRGGRRALRRPLELASALLKTARQAPVGARIELAGASFHKGGAMARRVRRLTRQGRRRRRRRPARAAPGRRPGGAVRPRGRGVCLAADPPPRACGS